MDFGYWRLQVQCSSHCKPAGAFYFIALLESFLSLGPFSYVESDHLFVSRKYFVALKFILK